jgi:hypothetical protein
MIMDPRINAETLYESEATLRMVVDALDELRLRDAEPILAAPRLTVIGPDHSNGSADTAELAVRAFWQVQEVLDTVQESREGLQEIGRKLGPDPVGRTDRGALDRAMELVDRLDSLEDGSSSERTSLHADLRRELIEIMNRRERRTRATQQLNDVALHLTEAEVHLARLAHLFEGAEG